MDSPFTIYAREHGFATVRSLPGSVGKYLSFKPTKVAPNSPALEELAKYMQVPLEELQQFAKAPPMGEKWVNKIRSQIDRGTLPQGAKHAAATHAATHKARKAKRRATGKRRGPYATSKAKNPLGKLIQEHGFTSAKLAKEIGVKVPVIWKASMGDLAPNHPLVSKLADVLGEPVGKLAAMQSGRPLKDGMLAKVARQLGLPVAAEQSKRPGKGVVLGSIVQRARGLPSANGKHRDEPEEERESRGKRSKRGPQNRLASKRTDAQLRQSVRALISTLNVSVMKGDTHMPPIPLADMYAILQDYVTEKGIKASVLLDPLFGTLFDPR